LAEIQALSPLAKPRLKVCLDLFANRRIVRSEPGRRYRLLHKDMSREALARAGQSYRERQDRDQTKQQRMVEYAESHRCRWQTILDYFDSSELAADRCGMCDSCQAVSVPA
jgi:ATP-dependent DNA helicase RecQ